MSEDVREGWIRTAVHGIAMRRQQQGRELAIVRKEGGRKRCGSGFSPVFYQDVRMVAICLMLAGRGRAHFFGTISKLIRDWGKRLDDRKVRHLFPDV
jgi:hypothetical protein